MAREQASHVKTRARLPNDVWLGVATYCSVDKLLEFETTCRAFRDLARGKSMDSVWRQRFRMAEPALATVLLDQPPRAVFDSIDADGRHIDGNGDVVVHAELSGRDFCRLYESRWRYKETDKFRPEVLGVAPWNGSGHTPWNEPRVIIVVDDVAGELAWHGYNGHGVREEDLSLTWVPNESAAQREYTHDEICGNVKTSCFLVDNQKIVELWREIRKPADDGLEADESTLMTYEHGSVKIFAFNGDRVPQDRFHELPVAIIRPLSPTMTRIWTASDIMETGTCPLCFAIFDFDLSLTRMTRGIDSSTPASALLLAQLQVLIPCLDLLNSRHS